jgi:hypothetical protein
MSPTLLVRKVLDLEDELALLEEIVEGASAGSDAAAFEVRAHAHVGGASGEGAAGRR